MIPIHGTSKESHIFDLIEENNVDPFWDALQPAVELHQRKVAEEEAFAQGKGELSQGLLEDCVYL